MIKINKQFSISYLDGYILTHEHFTNKDGEPKIRPSLTHPNNRTAASYMLENGVLQEELERVSDGREGDGEDCAAYKGKDVFEQAKIEVGVNAAKSALKAKANFSGFAKK